MAKTYSLISVSTSLQARVEVYKNAAERAADAGRGIGVAPTPGSGLVFEAVTTPGNLFVDASPQIIASNTESIPTNQIAVAITNTGSGSAIISTTFVFLPLE